MGVEVPMPDKDEFVRVRLDLLKSDHAELRVLAARSGMSMSQFCAALVLEAIRKQRVVKPPKEGK